MYVSLIFLTVFLSRFILGPVILLGMAIGGYFYGHYLIKESVPLIKDFDQITYNLSKKQGHDVNQPFSKEIFKCSKFISAHSISTIITAVIFILSLWFDIFGKLKDFLNLSNEMTMLLTCLFFVIYAASLIFYISCPFKRNENGN